MIRCVLWDNDGTILDTTELILESYIRAIEGVLGIEATAEEALAQFGKPLRDVMELYSVERAEELMDAYRDHNHEFHDEMIRPFPGILDALANVRRRGLAQGVVTSKTEWLTRQGLELFGLEGYIQELVGFESTEGHKPGPEPVLEALKRLDIDNGEALFIGDSEADAFCAQNAGVDFAFARWGPNPNLAEELPARWIFDDPRDVLRVIPDRVDLRF